MVCVVMWEASESTVVAPFASIEAVTQAATQAVAERGALLEATLLWGGDLLAIRHLRPWAGMRVRDLGLGVSEGLDLVVAGPDESGELALRLPGGAVVPPGCRMTVRFGRAVLRLALVADDVRAPGRARPDRRTALGVLAAAALHFVVLGFIAHGRQPEGAEAEDARETMQRMMTAAEERATVEATGQQNMREESAPAIASSPAKEQGGAGNLAKTSETPARARITRGEDRHATKPGREEVATFGLIAILAGDVGATRAGSSAFAAETGPSAMGNIFGQTIDDAAGTGGLGLTGPGEGGGGRGEGVSLGAIGTLGHTGGVGTGQGFGCCGGRLPRREHVVTSPTMRGGDVQVNGRLPPEAIQRVIRQSFGRLRGCYESGLQHRPDLEGRIAVKFVIDREGQVALASAAERTLDDESVARCVVKAYESMTFPKPEGGIVTVVYPVVFSRTSP